jgi:hypothetical protein
MTSESRVVHRTARIRVRATRRQADRCHGLLRSAGDVWAWLLNTNYERLRQGLTPVTKYQALCRELTVVGTFGQLSVAAPGPWRGGTATPGSRRPRVAATVPPPGSRGAGEPWYRSASTMAPSCCEASGCDWRLPGASPSYPLSARAGPSDHPARRRRTAVAVGHRRRAVEVHDLNAELVGGVDLGIVCPYAVVAGDTGLLISGGHLRPSTSDRYPRGGPSQGHHRSGYGPDAESPAAARTAGFKGIEISSGPTTSPPRSAAEPRARSCRHRAGTT